MNTDEEIQKRKREEKREYYQKITSQELDVRKKYMGIRYMKNRFQPKTYFFKKKGQEQ